MVAINAIYDGSYFKPVDPAPVKGGYEVNPLLLPRYVRHFFMNRAIR